VAFDFAGMVESDFEDFMLADLGETCTYYSVDDIATYESTYGYLIGHTLPSGTEMSIIIATFTERDKREYDLGNLDVDDHKAYIPNSVTPQNGDYIDRDGDGERYEVVSVLHEHAIAGTKNFYSCHIRRRPTG